MTNYHSNEDRAEDAAVLDQVQELTWALLDDNVTEADVARLESFLNSDPSARREYLNCVELHVGLHTYFSAGDAAKEQPQGTAKSPILGFLNAGTLPLDLNAPTENA